MVFVAEVFGLIVTAVRLQAVEGIAGPTSVILAGQGAEAYVGAPKPAFRRVMPVLCFGTSRRGLGIVRSGPRRLVPFCRRCVR